MANVVKTRKSAPQSNAGRPGKKRRGAYNKYMVLIISLIAVFVLLGGAFGYLAYQVYGHQGIYAGVYAGGVDLEGMSRHEATVALERQIEAFLENMHFDVVVDEDRFPVTPRELGIHYNTEPVAAAAYNFGREGSFFARVGAVLRARMNSYVIDLEYSYDLDAFDNVAGRIADAINVESSATTYEVDEDVLVLTIGSGARHIDPLAISSAIKNKVDNNTSGDIELETGVGGRDAVDFAAIKTEIDVEPVDAYLDTETDPENPVVVPEVQGVSLDIAAAQAIISGEGEGPEKNIYRIPLAIIEPAVKREDIVYFTYDDLISAIKTKLNPGNKNRTDNIKLACSKIDGLILYPGDEFSFNKVVGKRTYDAGFKDASIYLSGEIVDGVGGGICQVSSTLYMAAVGADLEISERKNHRYTVTYTELGEDATVAYDSNIDFRFVNNTDYAIMIKVVQESDYVLCEFYGTLTEETRNKTVSMESRVTSYNPAELRYEISEDVPVGSTSVKNAGYNGYTVKVDRVVKQDGVEVSRTSENTSTYTRLDKVILINPAEASVDAEGVVTYVPLPAEPDPGDVTNPDPGDVTDPDPGDVTDPDPGDVTDPDPGDITNPDPGDDSDPGDDTEPEDLPDWLRGD